MSRLFTIKNYLAYCQVTGFKKGTYESLLAFKVFCIKGVK